MRFSEVSNDSTRVFALQDTEYAAFQSKLTPKYLKKIHHWCTRSPTQKAAKGLKAKMLTSFLALPHAYYDENICLLVSE